ncbi:nuclear RNA export factor 1 [Achroia grisella]|uniref:nuclear RNA export factor 1 n=1 Tax=Achroia grisella TaxID=688607 RepID=UPI0027D2EEBF|nr:nuclear RNA export factor 1 [Achroia grisella]XP_059062653.1 nuclear RNA export factor 1 [Achroia grisella]
MPKRGGGRPRNWDHDHFEHDDRTHSNNTRRVSFKTGPNKGKNKFRNWKDPKLLLDDDIDMGASGQMQQPRKGTFRGRGGRLNSPVPRGHGIPRKKFIAGLLPWYQIIIPYGAKHEKDVILKSLMSYISPEVFIPHYYKINGNAAMFYVDDVKIAEKLFEADRKIVMSDGFRLVVIVRNSAPSVTVDAEMKEKMKQAMVKRYNAATKALDLTKFHTDPDLADIFCALFRPMIMLAVIDIIADNIPDLEALNLNDNKLHGMEHLKILSTKLKNLKILYLADNRIPYVGSLDALKSLPLVELFLTGNPLVNKFNDHEIYVSDVRKKFPKLTRLDGVDLPPAIGFDVSEDVALPSHQQSFLVDPAGQDLVREFLTQFFAIYDSESRQPLLEAYHEHASMSMAANYLSNDGRNSQSTRLNAYISNSRNLIRITERESRRRHLKTGRLQVVSFLSDLPKTKHDLMGFAVDLIVFTPTMIVLTMNGVYKETNTTGNPTRSFHRTFVIVPNPTGGFCVVNDLLYVTNTTKEQEDKAFATGESLPASVPTPAAAPAAVAAAPAASDDTRKMMLNMLGQQTGMNEFWSMNCLQETGWDFQRALFIFNQLQTEGKIPPEAFVK